MFIYNGKFNWLGLASNETITFVFPAHFSLNDPVSAYWQWSVGPDIRKKASVASSGVVNSVTTTDDGYSRIHFSFGYYIFDATVTADFKTLSVTMRNTKGDTSGPFGLAAMHVNLANIRSIVVYTGTLNLRSYAKSEMVTLVVPYGIAEGSFIGLYHEWTVDAAGVPKKNVAYNGVFEDVEYGANGSITAVYKDSYYTFRFKFSGQEGSFTVESPQDDPSHVNDIAVTYSL